MTSRAAPGTLLAAEGLSNADIAPRLQLSAHTVRHYAAGRG